MNPVYNMLPTTPPGFSAIPYMVGDFVAPFIGGVARPYVPVNQSTTDAQISKYIISPGYNAFASRVYGQFGEQLGNTVGAMRFIDSIGAMTGYSPEQMRRDLSAGGRSFMSGTIGQFIAPMADSMLNQAGVTGGSFLKSMEAIHSGRMSLLGAGTYFSPFNAGQVHQTMGAAAAMMTLTSGLMSQRDADTGRLSLLTNTAVTQGFERERIAALVMRAAGSGLFTSRAEGGIAGKGVGYSGSFAQQLARVAGDYDIGDLTFDDFASGAGRSVDSKTAERLKTFTRQFADKMKGITEALGAMRDLTHAVDGIEDQLDDLTNGDWLRSSGGLYHARDTVFKLKALTQTYNVDPNKAITHIQTNRSILQNAAGFSPHLQALGINGGGMFGFAAQTAVWQDIEDKITASGARGDPRAEARIRYQGVNALARSMNTSAGKAAQLLAYGYQTGVFTPEQAEAFRTGLVSGDRGLMGESLNTMLVTMFGSAEVGRKMMNDTQFMQSVRMGLSDNFGAYANKMMMGGAAAELLKQEMHTAADHRLSYANSALKSAGMSGPQTAADVGRVVSAVMDEFASVTDASGSPYLTQYGALFKEQVAAMQQRGMSPAAALRGAVAAFKKDPATARFASMIDLAVKRQTAENNEAAFLGPGGLAGTQATSLLASLTGFGDIGGEQAAELRKLVKEGNASEALRGIDAVIGGLSSNKRALYAEIREDAGKTYERHKNIIEETREAERMLAAAQGQNYGSEAVSESINIANEAALRYIKDQQDPRRQAGSYDRFWESFSKSKLGAIYGDDIQEEYLDAVERGDVDYVKKMGRTALRMKGMAASLLSKNGWDLTYTGFFNSGIYAGNSAAAAAARDALANEVAAALPEDALLSADDRTPLAQDIVSLLTGNKDLKGLLKIVDPDSAFGGAVRNYVQRYQKFTEAETTYRGTQGAYREAMKQLVQDGRSHTRDYIETIVKDNPELSDQNIEDISRALGDFAGSKDIVSHLYAKQDMQVAQIATQKELKAVASQSGAGIRDDVADTKARLSMAERRKANAIAKGKKVFGFLDSLSLDEDSLDGAEDALADAHEAMFDLVSEKEVAAKAGVKSSHVLTKQEYAEAAMAVTKDRIAAGDEAALDVARKYSAAARGQTTWVTGEITIKNGNEQAPANLELSMGGGML